MDENLKLDLMEMGTRWQHYTELQDIFAVGIEILKHLNVTTSSDKDQQHKLECAVEVIQSRIDALSDRVKKTTWNTPLRNTIDDEVADMFHELTREKIDEAEKEHRKNDNPQGFIPDSIT